MGHDDRCGVTARLTRRSVLLGGAAVAGLALTGCASAGSSTPPSSTAPTSVPPGAPATAAAEAELAALEARFGGRLGVFAVDTGSAATVRHRADERFLMCSTHKALVAAAVVRLRTSRPGLFDQVIHYSEADLLEHAPVTSKNVANGMTVRALCEAAMIYSDNTADNLLIKLLDGPQAVTAFARSLNDGHTRLDRYEPDLNVGGPDEVRDTSTPAALAADLRALTLGDALDAEGRDLLGGWLVSNTTGDKLVRAGLPTGWRVGDKSGSGPQGETNDIAVVWPPDRAPWVIAVFTDPTDENKDKTQGQDAVAEATRIAAGALAR